MPTNAPLPREVADDRGSDKTDHSKNYYYNSVIYIVFGEICSGFRQLARSFPDLCAAARNVPSPGNKPNGRASILRWPSGADGTERPVQAVCPQGRDARPRQAEPRIVARDLVRRSARPGASPVRGGRDRRAGSPRSMRTTNRQVRTGSPARRPSDVRIRRPETDRPDRGRVSRTSAARAANAPRAGGRSRCRAAPRR